jgi:Flp pilus assembly protein TadG
MSIKKLTARLFKQERGSSIIELAIVFPILLLFFVGVAELGRLFYTYNTLAKATKLGARYLSNKRDLTTGTQTEIDARILQAKSLVVCGYEDCTNQTPILPGLNTTKVNITPPNGGALVSYVTVSIQDYPYAPGVFNLSGPTGVAQSAIYFPLRPGTTVRYMFSG